MYKGSCFCGAVRYEIDGTLVPIIYCHCSRCRKGTGSAFQAVSLLSAKDFRLTAGDAALRTFRIASGVDRCFCGTCGSPIFSRRDESRETLRLRIGTLDTPPSGKVSRHIFVGSKAPWDQILDDAPQHDEWP